MDDYAVLMRLKPIQEALDCGRIQTAIQLLECLVRALKRAPAKSEPKHLYHDKWERVRFTKEPTL